MNTYRKQKLKRFLDWIENVFKIGMNSIQETQFYGYKNEINNTRHMPSVFYSDYKNKLLSLAVAVEYCDDEDTTGERRKKIYTCYRKNNGNVHNDLLVLIDYVLRFFSENNTFLNEIQQIQQTIILQNKTIMNYKAYFEFKYNIIMSVCYGFRTFTLSDNLYKVIAQRYERGQRETQEGIQSALRVLHSQTQRTNERRQREIRHGILPF